MGKLSTPPPTFDARHGESINLSALGGECVRHGATQGLPTDPAVTSISASPELTMAHARLEILAEFERWHSRRGGQLIVRLHEFGELYNGRALGLADWVTDLVPRCSRGTLHTWRRARDQAKDQAGRLAALADKRGINGGGGFTGNAVLWRRVLEILQERPHGSIKALYRALETEFGDLPVLATVQRAIAKWKLDNPMIWAYWLNPDAAKGRFEPAYGDMSAQIVSYLQMLELDSSPSDVHCVDGRYALIACIDIYTRQVRILVLKNSNGWGVTTLLRRVFVEWGIPKVLKTDNGSDYTSHRMTRLCLDLGIRQELCPPFTPTAKPHIESFFKVLAHSYLFELSTGFRGHNVGQAQAIRNQQTFASRFLVRAKEGQKRQAIEIPLTAAELQGRIDRWLDHDYQHNPHSGLAGLTPFQMVSGWTGEVRREDPRKLDILLTDAPKTSGMPEGVRVPQADGLSAWGETYISSELVVWTGKQVRVRRDDVDTTRVYVFSLDWQFICVAEGVGGMAAQRQKEIAVEAKRINGKLVRTIKGSLSKKPQDRVTPILAQAERENGSLVALPNSSYSVETLALAGAQAAIEAMELAKAPLPVSNPLSAEEEAAYHRAMQPKASKYTDQEVDRWDASDRFLNLRNLSPEQLTIRQARWLVDIAPTNAAVKGILRLEARAKRDEKRPQPSEASIKSIKEIVL
ncbi:DDE-type integrase/transposase/recombinase [Candidatus Cyanaurora vandensis]|uniref:DDE-type integrase/transposase/recombinase n=2 Tax=Candidatus Cyanaurora vandensis TaxID=2714958 RepID=UPI00257A370E|nr:DDE-type integrase/transposase/recombinase [Candidatus Cyanaurora vandensis]